MDDLISRQAAIATAISGRVRTLPTTEDGENWIRVNEVRDSLLSLPSAERHGRWIDKYNDGDWHCSECGAIVEKDEQNRHNWYRCYHCGAKMDGEQNG